MPLPSNGPAAPTGNALSDANASALTIPAAQAAADANQVNQQNAAVASDCLWPPSAQVTVPIAFGYHQTFQVPCLLTYGEARALVAVGLIVGGLLLVLGGVGIMIAGEVAPIALSIIGARVGRGSSSVPVNTGNSPSGTAPPPAPAQPAPSPPQRTRGPMSQPKAQPRRGGRTQQGTQGTRSASTQRTKRGQGLAGP